MKTIASHLATLLTGETKLRRQLAPFVKYMVLLVAALRRVAREGMLRDETAMRYGTKYIVDGWLVAPIGCDDSGASSRAF